LKIILKKDIKTLGKKESMIEVNDGYARNYLLPRGLAVEANTTNLNVMNTRKEAEKSKKDRELAKARELAEKLKNISVVIKTKAGENGKLFGSITSKDISDKLKNDFNLEIDKKKINMPDTLKSLGTAEVEIRIYPEVNVKLIVKIEQS
jgi:large subunit ribosomal protein L9